MNTVERGQRVKYEIGNRYAAGGFEWGYAVVLSGKPRSMLRDGIGRDGNGITEPHVRAIPEGDSAAYWFPVADLRSA